MIITSERETVRGGRREREKRRRRERERGKEREGERNIHKGNQASLTIDGVSGCMNELGYLFTKITLS